MRRAPPRPCRRQIHTLTLFSNTRHTPPPRFFATYYCRCRAQHYAIIAFISLLRFRHDRFSPLLLITLMLILLDGFAVI